MRTFFQFFYIFEDYKIFRCFRNGSIHLKHMLGWLYADYFGRIQVETLKKNYSRSQCVKPRMKM